MIGRAQGRGLRGYPITAVRRGPRGRVARSLPCRGLRERTMAGQGVTPRHSHGLDQDREGSARGVPGRVSDGCQG